MTDVRDDVAVTLPLTAREVLAEGCPGELERLAEAVGATGLAAAGLASAAGVEIAQGIGGELTAIMRDFLDLDIGGVLLKGCRKHQELHEAAVQTRRHGGSAVVPLATRQMSYVEHPCIDMVVAGRTVHVFRFELRVVADARGVAGVVRNGALVGFTSGHCVMTVSFGADEYVIRASRQFDPHLVIPLGPGVQLADDVIVVPDQRTPVPGAG